MNQKDLDKWVANRRRVIARARYWSRLQASPRAWYVQRAKNPRFLEASRGGQVVRAATFAGLCEAMFIVPRAREGA